MKTLVFARTLIELDREKNEPAVNSRTTTTVMTAHVALLPSLLNNGSIKYNKETSVRERPTLREWIILLGSSAPTFLEVFQHKTGKCWILSIVTWMCLFTCIFLWSSQHQL